ncbi:MAG: gephyrin-like molybdotransferase Glp [Candidatus Zixiibacteriota bacterium]
MITLQEAVKRIDEAVKRLQPASVPLAEAVGCLVSEDIAAPISVPQFSSSAMDGIALRVADLSGNGPWRLPIQSVIAAGHSQQVTLKDRHAAKVMTGAPLAEDADTVIPIESVTIESNHVIIRERPPLGEYVRPLGNDITLGQMLFRQGELLKPVDTGVLASVGITNVMVIPQPKIAVISTGSELVEPGEKLRYGQIYDSNSPALCSLLGHDRFPVTTRTRVSTNDREPLFKALRECIKNHDLVISTGGVSMGDYDFIPEITRTLGGTILFHKVAVKPGKPTLMAHFGDRWLLSLPGNPVSAVVGYYLYVRRIIARLSGVPYEPESSHAILASDVTITDSRYAIIGARLEATDGGLIGHPSLRQESGRLSSICGINGLIMVEGGKRTIKKGARVFVEFMDT